jgi:cytochrome P450/NADPH-cytochrome P450 reductase
MAFSRADGKPRTYVQDLIEREQDHVWDLLAADAVIYVCGNAHTMAPGVRAALIKIRQHKTGGTEKAAQQWLADLKSSDRLLEDIWGETAAGL